MVEDMAERCVQSFALLFRIYFTPSALFCST